MTTSEFVSRLFDGFFGMSALYLARQLSTQIKLLHAKDATHDARLDGHEKRLDEHGVRLGNLERT